LRDDRCMAKYATMNEAIEDLIDIGVNLTGRSFKKDIPELIERAQSAGVKQMVVTGTNVEHSESALALCEQWPGVLFATSGMHPHHAKDWSETAGQKVYQLAQQQAVRAIGECGLDYNRNFSSPEDQRHCFESQLELAEDLKLPVFMHQRDAHKDFYRIINRWRDKLSDGVVHCFTGTVDEAKAYLDLDLKIGVTGWLCDERRGQSLQEAVQYIPLDKIMLETDAPYLLPRDLPSGISSQLRERRNEPMVLPHVCSALARYKRDTDTHVARITTQLAREFFSIDA